MKNNNIEIRVVESWSENDIIELYKAGGWWRESYDKSLINSMISGSFIFAIVFDVKLEKTIGMGRAISDGISDAYIQDLIILPEYRKQGIGKKLLDFLVKNCLSKGIIWIGVISEPGSNEFYKNFGFKTMKDHTPMIYSMEE